MPSVKSGIKNATFDKTFRASTVRTQLLRDRSASSAPPEQVGRRRWLQANPYMIKRISGYRARESARDVSGQLFSPSSFCRLCRGRLKFLPNGPQAISLTPMAADPCIRKEQEIHPQQILIKRPRYSTHTALHATRSDRGVASAPISKT